MGPLNKKAGSLFNNTLLITLQYNHNNCIKKITLSYNFKDEKIVEELCDQQLNLRGDI